MTYMRIVSVNVGRPREVVWKGMKVLTGIFKQPVDDSITIREFNLDGDEQADLTVHGGAKKAVYAYPAEHYQYWQRELPDWKFSWGKLWRKSEHRRTAGRHTPHRRPFEGRVRHPDGEPATNALLQIGYQIRPGRHDQTIFT